MKERENYIDNLRVFMTFLVILHHTAITYGAPGGWYYNEKADGLASGLLLTVFVSTNQSFFMGMFFLLSSYFVPASLDRKGTLKFLLDRLKRLGIPLIFYSLVLGPVTIYILIRLGYNKEVSFIDYYFNREGWIQVGVLWFTAALLLFTTIYCAIESQQKSKTLLPAPDNSYILYFALGLGLISFVVRIFFPIGWTLEPVGFQFAHFPQYIALFTIGIIAYRNRWFESLSYKQGKRWQLIACLLLIIGFPCIYLLKEVTHAEITQFLGGLTIHSFINAMWEQMLGISIIVALLGIWKSKWNTTSDLIKELSRSAYAVYIIHPLVLVTISLLLKDLEIASLLKFLMTGSLAVTVSFLLGWILVRTPLIKEIV
ncbi:MAG: acyltransferase family protein [Cyclobacteriaceae bacterium]|nr:acyltransferase family protein [Cyclobacteriaceae bacterium]